MQSASQPLGKAMYVASGDDYLWLQSVQKKLYARSRDQPSYVFEKLWGLVTDPRNLRVAVARVQRNRGARTAGVDGLTIRKVLPNGDATAFVHKIRTELRSGAFRPKPARRVLIPKAGKPGKFRPLGIPTVKDRVIQAAMKNVLEPIFEADFYPISYGFRPGKSVHGAIEHLKLLMTPRGKHWKTAEKLPFQWALEGDIKGCFDNIDHHALMQRIRNRVIDAKLARLVLAFLKAGALSEAQFIRSDSGTPQGGILSPLLANIALGMIEERYERHAWPRGTATRRSHLGPPSVPRTEPKSIAKRAGQNRAGDKRYGRTVFMPVRYADDFIILMSTPSDEPEAGRTAVEHEKAALADQRELGLQLSEEKTLITPVTSTIRFLGHHLRVRKHPDHGALRMHAVIPKERTQRLRLKIKAIFRSQTCGLSLESRLRLMNPVVRGWANFYRHAWGAKRIFVSVDDYVWWTIYRWVRKKHPKASMRQIYQRYGWHKPRGRMMRWRDGDTYPVSLAAIRVKPFRLAWLKTPHFASTSMESPVRIERRTPGSVRGARKPARIQLE